MQSKEGIEVANPIAGVIAEGDIRLEQNGRQLVTASSSVFLGKGV